MTENEQKIAAKQFVKDWTGRGDEKQETQSFWLALLHNVFGVEEPEKHIQFEVKVKLSHTSFIDAYLPDTHVLIEQKGKDIDLSKGIKQSDGSLLTPYQQARRYAGYLPHDMNPRWIIVCNFKEFHIHDMNRPNDTPEVIELKDLAKEFYRFNFLVDTGSDRIQKEMEISLQAGELVGKLYDALLKQYHDPASEEELKSLNILCVRLVFCLYAEDAGIFGKHNMFHDFLKKKADADVGSVRKALKELFLILDQKPEDRDPYEMDEDLAAFPYVNGGLFANEKVIIPTFTEDIVDLLLSKASEDFNWSDISPTIFGAVFESTLNPETRRSGGMHYTSIENIHKVIDPLFLNDLTAELKEISDISVKKTRDIRLQDFQKKLSKLTFLDPACGSGNFLTETYLSLRRLENQAVALRLGDQIVLGDAADFNPIQVSIGQFYGIEINDFAVTVAKTALWIAESQMMQETEQIVRMHLEFLPLKSYANICEGNALTIQWADVVPKSKLNYIIGNPPFVGARMMDAAQKKDLNEVFSGWKNAGNLDFVSCWFKKSSDFMDGTQIRTALVSTNSITQGEAVSNLWKPLIEAGVHIDFAHRTFQWDSEAKIKAHVHCVIIGFSTCSSDRAKFIFNNDRPIIAKNINPYLIDADNIFIDNRGKPLCNVPEIGIGNKPIDGGNYLFTKEEMLDFIKIEPNSKIYFRPWYGAHEFINQSPRYCLWLGDVPPNILRQMPECLKRVEAVKELRLSSKSAGTRKIADKPTRFHVENMPSGNYIVIPEVSSQRRKYIPMGYMNDSVMCSNKLRLMPNSKLYHFGILQSNVHMAWMRVVCGRLKSDYDYSIKIVYNNFPWPTPNEKQIARIEETAQEILDARAKYPDCSLADLYDELTMPPELRTAHQHNDKAVMQAYGFWGELNSETECVAALMKMYQELTR